MALPPAPALLAWSDRLARARPWRPVAVISRPARAARPTSGEAGTQGVSRVLADPGSEHVELVRQWIARRWWWRWRQEPRRQQVHLAWLPLCPTTRRWLCADLRLCANSFQRTFVHALTRRRNQQVDRVPRFLANQRSFKPARDTLLSRWTQMKANRIKAISDSMCEPCMRQLYRLQTITGVDRSHIRSLAIIH
jgi:hypothetical protein